MRQWTVGIWVAALVIALAPLVWAAPSGKVVVAQGVDPTTLDPHDHEETPAFNVLLNIYDTLLIRDKDLKITPWLATSYKILNPTTWEFKLRQGVKFTNGEEFDAEVAKFSLERLANPANNLRMTALRPIDRVEVKDKYTIHIVTKKPCMAEGSGWELCPCGIGEATSDEGVEWCDPDTGLCWQDPPYEKGRGLCWESANDYCEQLIFDGHDDWWLPNITELRTLVADCPQIEVGGACQIEDGSGWNDMDIENCTSCGSDSAYSENDAREGCYWHASLHGLCNRVSVDPDVEFWSSSPNVDDPAHWAAFIHFGRGIMGINHTVSWGDVRCVRNKTPDDTSVCEPNDTLQCTCVDSIAGAKKCSSDGSGWGDCVCIAAGETFKRSAG